MRSEFTDETRSYLEIIQNVVSRMSTNCFTLKGWAVTLVVGILALSNAESDKRYILLSFIPLMAFWFLDAYYLQLEHKYRLLFDTIRLDGDFAIDFDLNPKTFMPRLAAHRKTKYVWCFFSKTELWFYPPIGAIVILVLIFVGVI